jgi:hypothetical protein
VKIPAQFYPFIYTIRKSRFFVAFCNVRVAWKLYRLSIHKFMQGRRKLGGGGTRGTLPPAQKRPPRQRRSLKFPDQLLSWEDESYRRVSAS